MDNIGNQNDRRARRVFRLLARLYPAEFRHEFEAELLAFFDAERRAERADGRRWWRIRLWLFTLRDLAVVAARLRIRSWRRRRHPVGHGRSSESRFVQTVSDLAAAARAFRRGPAFMASATLTLALGIGATTTMFSVADAVLFRPLPYPDGDRFVAIGSVFEMAPASLSSMSTADFLEIRDRSATLDVVTATSGGTVALRGNRDPELLAIGRVSAGFFDLLGATPHLGRLLVDTDHAPGAPSVALLGYEAWREVWAGDQTIVGRTISLDAEPYLVVGVLPRNFRPPDRLPSGNAQVWVSLRLADETPTRGLYSLSVIGRPRTGVTAADVSREVDGIVAPFYETTSGRQFVIGATAVSMRERILGDIGASLAIFVGAVILLLLIGCANVANLMLARAAARRHEVAMRAVLGAGPRRIVGQLLTESALLGLVAGAVGIGLAHLGVSGFKALSPGGVPRLEEVTVDWRILGFAVAISVLTGLVSGLFPAVHAMRADPADALRSQGRSATAGTGQAQLRAGLVVFETAMAVMLVLGSGLLLNSFVRLARVDTGFEPAGLMALQLDLRHDERGTDEWAAFYRSYLDAVRDLPGVRSAALTTVVPFTRDGIMSRVTPAGSTERVFVSTAPVSDRFFETMGMRILTGRSFDRGDDADTEPVVVVNEAFVREYWPDRRSPIGLHLTSGSQGGETSYRVVGVVADARHRLGNAPRPHVYFPYLRDPWHTMSVVVRTVGEPRRLAEPLRQAVRDLAPGLPISRLASVEDLAWSSLVRPRFYTLLTVCFGVAALTLALVGIYATTSYATRRRTREIGIRVALGAPPYRMVGMLVRRALALSALGIALGLTGVFLAARLLESYVYGIEPVDPPTFGASALLVTLATAAAAYAPARRASRVDPCETLREGT